MAAYSKIKSKHWTLTGSQVDSLTLTGQTRFVELVHHNDTTDVVYFAVDTAATAPTVAGDNFEVLLPNERIRISIPRAGAGSPVVSVISVGTPTISIIGIP